MSQGNNIDQKRKLDDLANEFEAAWKNERQSIEDFLKVRHSDLPQDQVCQKLIPLEIKLRYLAGDTQFGVEEYCRRFAAVDRRWLQQLITDRTLQPSLIVDPKSPNAPESLPSDAIDPSEFKPSADANLQSTAELNTDDETPVVIDTHREEVRKTPSRQRQENFGDYKIIKELGHGGMGVVYQAVQKSANREVALKVIRADRLAALDERRRQTVIDRFKAEAQATAQLDHPNLVTIYDVGSWEGEHYYSMKWVNGPNLAETLRDGPLDNVRAAKYARSMAMGVHAAHSEGILHRDLKPHNVMIDEASDRAMVADFGLAKLVELEQSATRTGEVFGSPPYMSPEQTQDASKVTTSTDVYGIGATLYQLVTARPPFQAGTVVETIRLINNEDPVAPRRLNPAVDADLETICMKCLEKDPSRRYESADAIAKDLDNYLAGKPISARPVTRIDRLIRWSKRSPRAAMLIGVSIGLALALMTTLFVSYLLALSARDREIALKEEANDLKAELEAEAILSNQNLLKVFEVVDRYLVSISNNRNLNESLRKSLLEEAIPALEQIVQQDLNEPRVWAAQSKAYLNLAQVQLALGDKDKAQKSIEQCIRISDQLVEFDPEHFGHMENLAAAHVQLGNLQSSENKTRLAEQSFQKALGIYADSRAPAQKTPDRSMAIASIHANLGTLIASQDGRIPEALQQFEQALKLHLEIVERYPDNAENLVRLMRLYNNQGNGLKAAQSLIEAEKSYRSGLIVARKNDKLLMSQPDYLGNRADIRYSLGVLLQVLRRFADAQAELDQSLQTRLGLVKRYPDNYLHRLRVAITQEALAYVRMRRGDPKSAGQLLVSATETLEPLVDKINDPRIRMRLSSILDIRGTLLTGHEKLPEKNFENAVELYTRACDIRQEMVDKYPKIPEYRRLLASSYFNLGRLYDIQGKQVLAEEAYLTSMRRFRELVEQEKQVAAYALDLSDCMNNLANLYMETDRVEDAQAMFREMIPILEELPKTSIGVLLNLGRVRMNFGDYYVLKKKDELALQYLTEAGFRFEKILALSSNHFDARVLLTSTLADRADICGRLGKIEEGNKLWAEAIKWAPAEVKTELRIRQAAWKIRHQLKKKDDK